MLILSFVTLYGTADPLWCAVELPDSTAHAAAQSRSVHCHHHQTRDYPYFLVFCRLLALQVYDVSGSMIRLDVAECANGGDLLSAVRRLEPSALLIPDLVLQYKGVPLALDVELGRAFEPSLQTGLIAIGFCCPTKLTS